MDPTLISALAVLGGSLVGAMTSIASTWLTQQHQDRRELLGKHYADRETLYSGFISEASRAVVDALATRANRIDGLIPLYALYGRIRLSSSETVIAAAQRVLATIIAEYAKPATLPAEIQAIFQSTKGHTPVDPLADFSRVCREELRTIADSGTMTRQQRRHALRSPTIGTPVRTPSGVPS
ncbi:MAG: hypothetical protein NTV94_18600 [Planctomycetota bacterium]|nr:hypothetical protein [Planctomycetota bacterium]